MGNDKKNTSEIVDQFKIFCRKCGSLEVEIGMTPIKNDEGEIEEFYLDFNCAGCKRNSVKI